VTVPAGPTRRTAILATVGALVAPVGPGLRWAAAQAVDEGTVAAFAESVERALVAAYGTVADRTGEGLRPLVETHRRHHREHASVFAELAGRAATGRPNPTLEAALAPGLEELSSQFEALTFARTLEDQVATTYAWAVGQLGDAGTAGELASILAVEASHSATLRTLLEEPLDASFAGGAFEVADITVGFAPDAFPLP